MKGEMKRIVCLSLLCALCGTFISSAYSVQTGASFLKIVPGARTVAMGESAVATTENIYAVYSNPAGLTQLTGPEVSFMYNFWFQKINYQFLAFALPTQPGTFAGNLVRLGTNNFPGYDAQGKETTLINSSDYALTLSYARTLFSTPTQRFSLGLNAKLLRETLADATAYGYAFDTGLLYKLGQEFDLNEFSAGVLLQHFGKGYTFDKEIVPLPSTLRLGIGYKQEILGNSAIAEIGTVIPKDTPPYLCFGIECCLYKMLALRLGYRTRQSLGSGLRAGIGITLRLPKNKKIQFDYAWTGFAILGDTHQVCLTYSFNQEEKKSLTSQTHFQKGVEYFENGEYYRAIIEFGKVLQTKPGDKKALEMLKRTNEKLQ